MKIEPREELRKLMNGDTQEQVAERLGVSQAEISHCLTGKRPASKALLAKLGLELRINREYVRTTRAAGDVGKDRRRSANPRS